jgi:hypothetical protein
MCVSAGPDHEGCLVLVDDCLVAVLVRLSDWHGDAAGSWFYEAGFGSLDGPEHPLFADLGAARTYIARRLADNSDSLIVDTAAP